MSLMVQSQMANDHNLIARAATAAIMLGVEDARIWAQKNSLLLATQPGWVELYSEALSHEPPMDPAAWVPRVGGDPTIITDDMIVQAVKNILGVLPIPEVEEPQEEVTNPEPVNPNDVSETEETEYEEPGNYPDPEPDGNYDEPDIDPDEQSTLGGYFGRDLP